MGFRWFSPFGEMPPLLFGRQSGNRNRSLCFGQTLLIPTFAAEQYGRNFASQRPVEILALPIIITHFLWDYQTGLTFFRAGPHTLVGKGEE